MDMIPESFLKYYINKTSSPAAVIDNNFMCLLSNRSDLLPVKHSTVSLFQKPITLPLTCEHINLAVLKGVSYCAKIVPVSENLNICEFFNYRSLLKIAENSDFCERLLMLIGGMDFNTAALWKNRNILKSRIEKQQLFEYSDIVSLYTKHLTALNTLTKNIIEYLNMLLYDPICTKPLNIALLIPEIIDRCNSIIEPTGRYINYLCDDYEIYIDADHRHAVTALVNALQNALIYSPRESVPVVTLSEDLTNNTTILRVVNKSILKHEIPALDSDDFNSANTRPGCGIPIIKRFAQLTGGEFTIQTADDTVEANLIIPTLVKEKVQTDKAVLRSNVYVYYETGIPDLVTLMMNEVKDLFSA